MSSKGHLYFTTKTTKISRNINAHYYFSPNTAPKSKKILKKWDGAPKSNAKRQQQYCQNIALLRKVSHVTV